MRMVIEEDLARILIVLAIRLEEHHAAPFVDNTALCDEAKLLVSNRVAVGWHEMRWVNDYLVHILLLLMSVYYFLLQGLLGVF